MIETLLGGLLDGIFRLAPEVLKWLDRKGERGHELAMQDKALEFEKLRGAQRMAEIGASADAAWNTSHRGAERSGQRAGQVVGRALGGCAVVQRAPGHHLLVHGALLRGQDRRLRRRGGRRCRMDRRDSGRVDRSGSGAVGRCVELLVPRSRVRAGEAVTASPCRRRPSCSPSGSRASTACRRTIRAWRTRICPAGFWTIGYGHLCDAQHPPITEAEAETYLARDLQTALAATLRHCPVLATEPPGGGYGARPRWRCCDDPRACPGRVPLRGDLR